jgi:mTERF
MRWVFDDSDVEDSDFEDLFLDEDEDDYFDGDADDDAGQFMKGQDGDDDDADDDEEWVGPDAGKIILEDSSVRPKTKNLKRSTKARKSAAAPDDISTRVSEGAKKISDDDDVGAKDSAAVAEPLGDVISSSQLSYFYLRDELGLSEDAMWKVTTQAPSVLGFKAANVREKVRVLKSTIGLTHEDVRTLVASQPTLLQLSARRNVAPTILFLLRQLDLGRKDLRKLVMGCPALLKYAIANLNDKLVFFQETMGYSVSECRDLLLSDPRLLTCSVRTGLIPRLSFLHREVGIGLPDLRKIVRKNPAIMKMSVHANLQPKLIYYYIMTLRMTPEQVGRMLLKYPQLLNYNLENHTMPIYRYFMSLDFSTHEFAYILRRFPRLTSYGLNRIKQRIGYLRYELCLDAASIRHVVRQSPQVVSLTMTKIRSSVEYLLDVVEPGATLSCDAEDDDDDAGNHPLDGDDESEDGGDDDDGTALEDYRQISAKNGGCGDDDEGNRDDDENNDADVKANEIPLLIVQTMVAGLPSLLNLNIESNLQPKVEYLRQTMGQEELSHALMRLPALLGYSLENRIRPRMEQLLAAGLPCGRITVGISLKEEAYRGWLERSAGKIRKKEQQQRLLQLPSTGSSLSLGGKEAEETQRIEESVASVTESGHEQAEEGLTSSRVWEEGGRIIHWLRPRGPV